MVGTARCAVRVRRCNVEWPFVDAAARRPYQVFPIPYFDLLPRTQNNAPRFQNSRDDRALTGANHLWRIANLEQR